MEKRGLLIIVLVILLASLFTTFSSEKSETSPTGMQARDTIPPPLEDFRVCDCSNLGAKYNYCDNDADINACPNAPCYDVIKYTDPETGHTIYESVYYECIMWDSVPCNCESFFGKVVETPTTKVITNCWLDNNLCPQESHKCSEINGCIYECVERTVSKNTQRSTINYFPATRPCD